MLILNEKKGNAIGANDRFNYSQILIDLKNTVYDFKNHKNLQ